MKGLQECLNRVATLTSCAGACLAAERFEPVRRVATSPAGGSPAAATLRTLARPAAFDPAMSKAALRASVEAYRRRARPFQKLLTEPG